MRIRTGDRTDKIAAILEKIACLTEEPRLVSAYWYPPT